MRRVIPVEVPRSSCYEQEEQRKCGSHRMSAKPARADFLTRLTQVAGARLGFRRRTLGLDGRPLVGLSGWPLLGLANWPLSSLRRHKQPGPRPIRPAGAPAFRHARIRVAQPPMASARPFRDRQARQTSSQLPSIGENRPRRKTILTKIWRKTKRYRSVPLYNGGSRRYFKMGWARVCPITVL